MPYLRGLPHFEVQTDHKPLEKVFQHQMYSMDNVHLLRMREKLPKYDFDVHWTPGKNNIVADALSRATIFDPEEEELTTSLTLQCLTATWGLEMLL